MSTKTKKIIFWSVVAVLLIGIGVYLQLTDFGNSLMAVIIGICGIVVGWVAHILYLKYIKK